MHMSFGKVYSWAECLRSSYSRIVLNVVWRGSDVTESIVINHPKILSGSESKAVLARSVFRSKLGGISFAGSERETRRSG